MISWKDLTVQQERYKDFAREIDHDRLVDLANGSRRYQPYHARLFAWLGVRLSTVGGFLQRRYGPAAEIEIHGVEKVLQLGAVAASGTGGGMRLIVAPDDDLVAADDEELAA